MAAVSQIAVSAKEPEAPMQTRQHSSDSGVLAQLTLPQLIDIWVEREIDKRLREVEFFHSDIVSGARQLDHIQVMPLRGGVHDRPRSVEVLVEVRDHARRYSRIGAWTERKRAANDLEAFHRAYEKALAHAIIQLIPAATYRPWIRAAAQLA